MLLAALLLVAAPGALPLPWSPSGMVPKAQAGSTDSVLLLGNSFTAGIRARLRSVARSAGRRLRVVVRGPDGMTLAAHAGSPVTQKAIRAGGWTAVILQEQSDGIDTERYDAARALHAEAAATGARTLFLMTWRDRGADLAEYDSLRGVPGGSEGYVPIAEELGATVAPVGWGMREILATEPAADFWGADGHHAGERGKYLAALVLYATLYGESPVGLWESPFLPSDVARRDQQAAADLVLGSPGDWNFEAAD